MGGGRWETERYKEEATTRALRGESTFKHTERATAVHASLDPRRINSKPFGKLESRDSEDHPNSWPVILTLDVTGSNVARAAEAQQALPTLMDSLISCNADPQVAIWANDDFYAVKENCIQVSDFESDNRVDEALRNIWLTSRGGANQGESYDLLLYAAARKTIIDSMEKRGKKGYLFLYADEPIFQVVSQSQVKAVFGDDLQEDIPIAQIVQEAQQLYHIFVLWPSGGYENARSQFVSLFGPHAVITLQDPSHIVQQIVSLVTENEASLKAGGPGIIPTLPAVSTPVGAVRL